MVLINCFSYSDQKEIYDITFPIMKEYCIKHNFKFQPFYENLEKEHDSYWNKLHYSLKMLQNSVRSDTSLKYFVWFDPTIILKNHDISLEAIIHESTFSEKDALFLMSRDPENHNVNSGVLIFKNQDKTLKIFQEFLQMRDNPSNYPQLEKYKNFPLTEQVMLAYFEEHQNMALTLPHKVLQSFYGIKNFYSKGDFCGNVLGISKDELLLKLKELTDLETFDVVIPIGPNDRNIIEKQIAHTKKNIIGYRRIYLIPYDPSFTVDGCITVNENIFPFNKETVAKYHGRSSRNGWYLQQLLKLYAGKVLPGILDRYLIIDSDTLFLKPTTFLEDGKCLYNYGTEYHLPYFEHMKRLDPDLERMERLKSGICHHMIFETKYIQEIISKVEKNHNDLFYNVFLKCVGKNKNVKDPCKVEVSGASEYEIYFNFRRCWLSRYKLN